MQASSRRAHRSVGVVVAGAIASALMASCAHGPRAHVLGKVIERSTTTDVASDPASTVSGAGTATTPTTASGTVTTNGGAVTTIAKPRPSTPSPPAATTKTTAAPSPAPTTTPATVAGESLAPGPYLEQSDGSGVLDVTGSGITQLGSAVAITRGVTYRIQFDLEFGDYDPHSLLPAPRVNAFLQNTSASQIDFPGGFQMALTCTRDGQPWLALNVVDPTISFITPGGLVNVSTSNVAVPGPGTYTCSATAPIILH